jgi:hypothetical protein
VVSAGVATDAKTAGTIAATAERIVGTAGSRKAGPGRSDTTGAFPRGGGRRRLE